MPRYAKNYKNSSSLSHSNRYYVHKMHKKMYSSVCRKPRKKRIGKLFKSCKRKKYNNIRLYDNYSAAMIHKEYQKYYQEHKAEIDNRNTMWLVGIMVYVVVMIGLCAIS